LTYNGNPVDDDELLRRYQRDVADGWISPLCGFDNYKSIYYQIEYKAIGMETKSGIVVKQQSEHFITRIIGTSLNPSKVHNGVYPITGVRPQGFRSNARSGVTTDDIIDTIQNGVVEEVRVLNGRSSQRITGAKCVVSVNPITGKLIQCNPVEG